jgi:hypothetical protein
MVWVDSAEEHEDTGDDAERGRYTHLRHLFVRCLRDEMQGDIFVLE